MRAIVVDHPGGPEVLQWRDVAALTPGAGEVLVRVRAAGVNRADLLQRMGKYPPPPGESGTIGLEIAGEVLEPNGARDQAGRGFARGERVMALLAGGGYAEQASVPAGQAMRVPENLSFAEAAAIPEVFITAWLNLLVLGRLAPGELAIVHAAASGVGTAALQLARVAGARVLATASAKKLEQLQIFKPDGLLAREEVPGGLREAAARLSPAGADVVLDLVGASYWKANLDALALNGRLVCIATQGGAKTELDLGLLMQKRLTLFGSTLRARPREEKARLVERFSREVLPRFAAGQLRPVIAQTLPIARAAEAHQLLARNELVGKLVLEV